MNMSIIVISEFITVFINSKLTQPKAHKSVMVRCQQAFGHIVYTEDMDQFSDRYTPLLLSTRVFARWYS